jgi:hypothetical protein
MKKKNYLYCSAKERFRVRSKNLSRPLLKFMLIMILDHLTMTVILKNIKLQLSCPSPVTLRGIPFLASSSILDFCIFDQKSNTVGFT